MKAMILEKFGDVNSIHMADVDTPQPGPAELQVELAYAGVNPVDWKIAEGMLKARLPHEFPLILGWDGAGTVSAAGPSVKDFKVGDAVFGYFRKPKAQWGTYGEYVCFDAANIAKKPEKISFAQAAAIPLTALTAWQSLFDAAKLQQGETVLIHAGAGGVGGCAIQFAKNVGARVITTARTNKHAYCKELGADAVIDYTKENFVDVAKRLAFDGVDVVFDTVGGDTLRQSFSALRRGGRMVSIVENLDAGFSKPNDTTFHYVFVSPNGAQLKQIADLIRIGKVRPPAIEEMPLEKAADALGKSREGRVLGKIVLRIK